MAAPTSEKGYVVASTAATDWQVWDLTERVPELRWPQAVHVYTRMGNEDGRIDSVLQAIGLPILRTQWWIDPNGARDEVAEFVARNLGLRIKGAGDEPMPRTRGRFSWGEHLQFALQMLQYGHSVFEQVYRIGDDGRAHLRKLAPRPQTTITKFNVARDGGLESIEQAPPAGSVGAEPIRIPISRLVAYVRRPYPGVWTGKSILRTAYKHWLLKDELIRIQAAAARRNGMGVPVYTNPPEASQEDVAKGKKMTSEFRGGSNSGASIPYDSKLALLGVQGNLPDLQRAIEYHDKQIALAGLAHFLNLDRGGSYALASVQADIFVQSLNACADSIADVANQHVVEDLVDLNWGIQEPAPRIVFDEIGELDAQTLKLLADAGILFPDRRLEEAVRDRAGLPAKQTREGDTE